MQAAFADDWLLTTGETLTGPPWYPPLETQGSVIARGILQGPDEDFDRLRRVLLGALACAQQSIHIVTPYFLPDAALLTALQTAALRGVDVRILLPEENNLRMVKWASMPTLNDLVDSGCRVLFSPPPFDHSKIMVVDGAWVLLGSANWDPRSLRLNFEFNLECYDTTLAGRVGGIVTAKLEGARRITIEELNGLPFLARLRNRAFRLFSPYL
jgi:cardiolipin synthase